VPLAIIRLSLPHGAKCRFLSHRAEVKSPQAAREPPMADTDITVRCCIAGGGPAGMMLGLLLARTGIDVLVLEKHADFLRDFRGDTIHPSTLEVIHELGLLDEFLKLPHQEARILKGQVGPLELVIADFSHLPTRCRFIALMPQWDFLNFLARQAARYPGFTLRMRTEATGLIEENGRIVGVEATGPEGGLRIRADLVIGADGRTSRVRAAAGLDVEDLGAPIDVLWFRLPRRPGDPEDSMGRFEVGHLFVMINRGDYWQCAYVIAKGTLDTLKARGIDSFRGDVAVLAPFARDRVDELRDWDTIKLLTVRVDRLRRWHCPGLLCIGDAAHAMSPVGGVGINLAIQDAVAAANILAPPLRDGPPAEADLHRVQQRRMVPTRVTQWLQVLVQNRVIDPVLGSVGALRPPLAVRLMAQIPFLRRIPARLIGLGIRPEHIRT
jgi:2-polyprenyl-6-methoxyphenol hydroxylase-like FAD-dependent oxidoreductase